MNSHDLPDKKLYCNFLYLVLRFPAGRAIMQMSAGVILPGSPRQPPQARLHINGEGHGAVQYVQDMPHVPGDKNPQRIC